MPKIQKTQVSGTASDNSTNSAAPTNNNDTGINFKDVRIKAQQKTVLAKHGFVPLSLYRIKDFARTLVSNNNFTDALATTFTVLSVSLAFPLVPWPILIAMLFATFIITYVQPFVGLIFLLFETLPMMIYQAPLFAWIFTLFISVTMIAGFKYYRTIIFTYMLITLPLSSAGYFLLIPALVITVLSVGFKRSVVACFAAILFAVMIAGFTGIPLTGGLLYNQASAYAIASKTVNPLYISPSKPAPSLSNVSELFGSAFALFLSLNVMMKVYYGLFLIALPLAFHTELIFIQLMIWLVTVFAISSYAVSSRSKFKGSEASLFSGIIVASYIIIATFMNISFSVYPIIGYIGIVLFVFVLEMYNVEIIKALDVMKQDFRGKFGEMYEDLSNGTIETFNNVANYEETKKELKEAILSPLEKKELAGAYNIKPPKGILLFGPPGTGKTLIMRALANEIHAGFFYVKTSSILSSYSGESSNTLTKIFATAKKHSPAILFFDEIDSIAGSRLSQGGGENEMQILSTLLTEMDGFQSIEKVIIVGATNMPQLLDPGIMRPGRFDKIIYMPLPNLEGRRLIFKYYLSKLPVSNKMDYNKLAEVSERYSGADIKNACDEVARSVATVAAEKNTVLSIETDDVLQVIKMMKPSTSLALLDMYKEFKATYERRGHVEESEENTDNITINDVVGLEEVKKSLYNAVELPILHPELVKKYDIKAIKGVLMFGPPGTGKSMLMRAISNEIGETKFISVSGVEILRNGGENAVIEIKKMFERAEENAPSIIFVDEIDTLIPSRENASEEGSMIAGEFLQELDGIKKNYEIVFVGATNRPYALDPAILRAGRFDKVIYIPPPTEKDREVLWKINLIKAPVDKGINFEDLAKHSDGYTGADITNICEQAKIAVMERSNNKTGSDFISQKDIIAILEKVKPSAPESALLRYKRFIEEHGER
jgi:SpoVK/Ycf46/Vps4 family AAA+-type ATPase